MSNILAGIGRGQMKVIDKRVEQRRSNNNFYRTILNGCIGLSFQSEPNSDYFSNYWLTAITIDPLSRGGQTREDVRLALEKENIESRPLWKPMHLQPIFKNFPAYINGTSERLFENGLCLPSGSNLTDVDRLRIKQSMLCITEKTC